VDSKAAFAELVKHRHELEERRLAYVAVTRARHSLLITGSFWATQSKPRGASPFLTQLADAGILSPFPVLSESDDNPLGADVDEILWPLDPLGGRRARVEAAAAAVREAEPGGGPWVPEVELLLGERAARLSAGSRVPLPSRVPASRFKDFVTDPSGVASSLRRPMPERPYRATRLGTLFHSWVEERSGATGSRDELDALPTELDLDDSVTVGAQLDAEKLDQLKLTFERSRWAGLAPIEVEREIHLVLDGQVIICKIDAVYRRGERYEVVDWKTGKAPRDDSDLDNKQLQLALYRLAYSRWAGIDIDLIDAVFYYVADDRVITPAHLYDEQELVDRWRASLLA